MNNIQNTSDGTFEQDVLESEIPVLVDFWAPWCGPCRMVAPVLEAVAESMKGKVKIVKMNTDENQKLARELRIMGIPTLVIFKGGRETERIVGFRPQGEIEALLSRIVSAS